MENHENATKRFNKISKYLMKTEWPVFVNCESCGNRVRSDSLIEQFTDAYVEHGFDGIRNFSSQELEMDCPECKFRIYMDYDDSEDREDADIIREIAKDFIKENK